MYKKPWIKIRYTHIKYVYNNSFDNAKIFKSFLTKTKTIVVPDERNIFRIK